MAEKDQVKPLAPSRERQSSDEEDASLRHSKRHLSHRKYLKLCGCIVATKLVLAAVVLTLVFTVFRVKEPIIKMNGVTVTRLELINNAIPKPGVNISLVADISVKNPNVASFKYKNTTTRLFYGGTVVGEARGPPGQARARRTVRMNITVDIITDRIMSNPGVSADLGAGVLRMSGYSRVPGRVRILRIIKKHVIVKMNCSMTVNITSRAIDKQECKRKVDLKF